MTLSTVEDLLIRINLESSADKALESITKQLDTTSKTTSDLRSKVEQLGDSLEVAFGKRRGAQLKAALENIEDPLERSARTADLFNSKMRRTPGILDKLNNTVGRAKAEVGILHAQLGAAVPVIGAVTAGVLALNAAAITYATDGVAKMIDGSAKLSALEEMLGERQDTLQKLITSRIVTAGELDEVLAGMVVTIDMLNGAAAAEADFMERADKATGGLVSTLVHFGHPAGQVSLVLDMIAANSGGAADELLDLEAATLTAADAFSVLSSNAEDALSSVSKWAGAQVAGFKALAKKTLSPKRRGGGGGGDPSADIRRQINQDAKDSAFGRRIDALADSGTIAELETELASLEEKFAGLTDKMGLYVEELDKVPSKKRRLRKSLQEDIQALENEAGGIAIAIGQLERARNDARDARFAGLMGAPLDGFGGGFGDPLDGFGGGFSGAMSAEDAAAEHNLAELDRIAKEQAAEADRLADAWEDAFGRMLSPVEELVEGLSTGSIKVKEMGRAVAGSIGAQARNAGFDLIRQQVSEGAEQLGKYLVLGGTGLQALASNPAAAILVGGSLIALGGALGSIAQGGGGNSGADTELADRLEDIGRDLLDDTEDTRQPIKVSFEINAERLIEATAGNINNAARRGLFDFVGGP